MLGFLPIEKIPIFIWGLILALVTGFLAAQEEFLAKQQIIDLGMVVIGIMACAYDVKKRIGRGGHRVGADNDTRTER